MADMKSRRPEQALHRAVIQYLDAVLPADAWAFHVPNGGGRTKVEGAILKAMGVRPGIPDICIVWQGRAHWVEIKSGKGRLSDAQCATAARLFECGCLPVLLARSLDDAATCLRVFGIPTRESRRAA